eukprot:1099656-Rhodomonas_salina.1
MKKSRIPENSVAALSSSEFLPSSGSLQSPPQPPNPAAAPPLAREGRVEPPGDGQVSVQARVQAWPFETDRQARGIISPGPLPKPEATIGYPGPPLPAAWQLEARQPQQAFEAGPAQHWHGPGVSESRLLAAWPATTPAPPGRTVLNWV